ncbi:hypothetical protein Pmani_021808 [Petrolisthes manimaculis]|uniref:Uncharacterized protein n=1 Tax=Petrolisthes manimaculis TaxID=1843537 RepID=A0AAE1PFU7_9EUCA|nr:hypothetical protein Pmani_021808 [Petrolisthes manimaculis]
MLMTDLSQQKRRSPPTWTGHISKHEHLQPLFPPSLEGSHLQHSSNADEKIQLENFLHTNGSTHSHTPIPVYRLPQDIPSQQTTTPTHPTTPSDIHTTTLYSSYHHNTAFIATIIPTPLSLTIIDAYHTYHRITTTPSSSHPTQPTSNPTPSPSFSYTVLLSQTPISYSTPAYSPSTPSYDPYSPTVPPSPTPYSTVPPPKSSMTPLIPSYLPQDSISITKLLPATPFRTFDPDHHHSLPHLLLLGITYRTTILPCRPRVSHHVLDGPYDDLQNIYPCFTIYTHAHGYLTQTISRTPYY